MEKNKFFPGISTESILQQEVRKQKPSYMAMRGRMDRNTAERLEEMLKRQEMLERHRPSRANGGRIGLRRGSGPGPGGQGARGQATQNPGAPSGPGPGGQGARGQATQNPGITTPSSTPLGGDRIIDIAQRKKRQDIRDLIARQQAEKDYTRQGIMKTGPQLALAGSGIGGGGMKNFLGNWGSSVAGSKIGGGLGSMLLGPWGMLLGSIFGGGVGRRGWKASQTPKRETWKDIAFGENTLLSNLFSNRKLRLLQMKD